MSPYTPELHLQLARERQVASARRHLAVQVVRSQKSQARAVSATRRAQRLTLAVRTV